MKTHPVTAIGARNIVVVWAVTFGCLGLCRMSNELHNTRKLHGPQDTHFFGRRPKSYDCVAETEDAVSTFSVA